jgi:hypothetical protein
MALADPLRLPSGVASVVRRRQLLQIHQPRGD